MNVKEHNSLTHIDTANLGIRVLAGLIDGFIAVFVWLFLALIIARPILDRTLHYTDTVLLGNQYQVASHLFVYQQLEDNGDVTTIEVKDYTEKMDDSKEGQFVALANNQNFQASYYVSHIHYYYTSYLTGANIEMPNNTSTKTYDMVEDHFVSPDYLTEIDGKLPIEIYTTKFVNEEILKVNGDGGAYFETSDINVLATVKEGMEDNKEATNFLRNACNDAAKDLYYRGYFSEVNNTIKKYQLLLVLPAYGFTMITFYLGIPLIFRNGETLGKKFLHLAVINKLGYSVKRRQIILRFFVFFIEISLSLFVMGVGFTSIATLGLGILILFVATIFVKDHRSLHDLAAMTLVIDSQKSVWFNSFDEEEKYNKELEKNMDKYRSVKVENKNIIQVGGTIIDEDLKAEIEKKQK